MHVGLGALVSSLVNNEAPRVQSLRAVTTSSMFQSAVCKRPARTKTIEDPQSATPLPVVVKVDALYSPASSCQ